jgi:hypothetical protein
VGTLWWDHNTGEVKNVIVEDEYKRQGIAPPACGRRLTGFHPKNGWPRPRHSDDLTPDGAAWAKSVSDGT